MRDLRVQEPLLALGRLNAPEQAGNLCGKRVPERGDASGVGIVSANSICCVLASQFTLFTVLAICAHIFAVYCIFRALAAPGQGAEPGEVRGGFGAEFGVCAREGRVFGLQGLHFRNLCGYAFLGEVALGPDCGALGVESGARALVGGGFCADFALFGLEGSGGVVSCVLGTLSALDTLRALSALEALEAPRALKTREATERSPRCP